MVEKLIVEKFGPIKKIEIDLSKVLILIGPQSVGKSTIAKLVSILRGFSFVLKTEKFEDGLRKYMIESYLKKDTFIEYKSEGYSFVYQNGKGRLLTNKDNKLGRQLEEFLTFKDNDSLQFLPDAYKKLEAELKEISDQIKSIEESLDDEESSESLKKSLLQFKKIRERLAYHDELFSGILKYTNYSVYIPAERILIPVISNSIMNFIKHEIPVPKILTEFASNFENARQSLSEFTVDFLDITYKYIKNENRLYLTKKNFIQLNEASSGLQAIVPLLLVIKHKFSQKHAGNTYVVEEPELNLFPENQYEISKILAEICAGFDPENESYNELIITTHSPYILAAFNNFLLAHKLKEHDDEVSKIIPESSWVDASLFNAYYIDKKGTSKIFDEKNGLIAETQLDSASEAIMGDFDKLMDLYSQKLMNGKSD